jgi:hypothetical protein
MGEKLTTRIEGFMKEAEARRCEAENLLQLVSELSAHESFYSQGLSRLSLPCSPSSPSCALQSVFHSLHLLCTAKAQASQRLSSFLLTDLIDPLRILLLAQRTSLNVANRDIQKTLQELRAQEEQLSTAEDWYRVQLHLSEEFVVQMDHLEGREERRKLLAEQPEDVNWRMERATIVYRTAVDGYNEANAKLREELSALTAGLYMHEESRLSLVFTNFSKLHSLTMQCQEHLIDFSDVHAI